MKSLEKLKGIVNTRLRVEVPSGGWDCGGGHSGFTSSFSHSTDGRHKILAPAKNRPFDLLLTGISIDFLFYCVQSDVNVILS